MLIPEGTVFLSSPGDSGMRTSVLRWTYTATCSQARTKPLLLRWIGSPLFGSSAIHRQYTGSTTAPKTATRKSKALRKPASEGPLRWWGREDSNLRPSRCQSNKEHFHQYPPTAENALMMGFTAVLVFQKSPLTYVIFRLNGPQMVLILCRHVPSR